MMVTAAAVMLASVGTFAVTTRKSVALTVNGETKTVTTYANSVPRLLQEQGVKVKTHDFVQSAQGTQNLVNHDVVTVRSAYQTTITIDGRQVPFWTIATSADQLLGFFKQSDKNAAKVTVNVTNVYNQLTGGLVINKAGPVTVIADGKSSVAPNGKLTAASILDSKSITLGKEDRVSVEDDNGQTVLRVQRVTHGQQTRNVAIPFATHNVVDPKLQPGQSVIERQGQNGNKQQIFDVTYVDGVAESETLKSENITQAAVDEVIATGPTAGSNGGSNQGNDSSKNKDKGKSDADTGKADADANSSAGQATSGDVSGGDSPSAPGNGGGSAAPDPAPNPTPTIPTPPAQGSLWHATPAQAQAYAVGAAAQYGWTGADYEALVWVWNHESGWSWSAGNPSSTAYGIPQILYYYLYTSRTDWRDNAQTQVDAGLYYIAGRYGSPSNAKAFWLNNNWY